MNEIEKQIEKPEKKEVKLIRILATDIPGDKSIYAGLNLIKGISWAFSNAICKKLGFDKKRKIEDLSKEEIVKIVNILDNLEMPNFLANRRKDFNSGEKKSLVGSDLDLQREFDIKKEKKIKSYKGNRHSFGLPVRGQRTRSNFRKNKSKSGAVGVRGKK